ARQLDAERGGAALVRDAVLGVRARQRHGRGARHERNAPRELQRPADRHRRSDDAAVLQHVGVFGARARDLRQLGPRHRDRARNLDGELRRHPEHQLRRDARRVGPGERDEPVGHGAVRDDRHEPQLADVRPGAVGAADAAHPASTAVPILMLRRAARALIASGLVAGHLAAQQPAPVFRSGTEIVLVNVVVRDRTGAVVRGLTREDFSIAEDDKPQVITTFDFEELGPSAAAAAEPAAARAAAILPERPGAARPAGAPAAAPKVDMHGRRLIVLFFDLGSMQAEELQRAVAAAHDYVDRKLAPADLIAVASFATSLTVNQDFTSDRAALDAAIDAFGGNNASGFEAGTTGDTEDTPDTGGAFTADDTEFNIFNTDRRLDALQTLADSLAGIEQKKSVVYFSSGMSQQGTDNQVQLRRTVDRANRANVSIYAADMRGLQAQVPGGDATTASRRGTSPFSGASVRNQFESTYASQDTLTTMAEDTGGRAFFDANTFGQVFDRVVNDTSAYYVLGYS